MIEPSANFPTTPSPLTTRVAIVGGGPAGLIAAQRLAEKGLSVSVFDAMPSIGRKFLMAGRGGLNLTHSEAFEPFLARYGEAAGWLAPYLRAFDANALRQWAKDLGVETFVGSSGRVFPSEMKAAPLMRAWQHRLRQLGVHFHVRHRWLGALNRATGPAESAGSSLHLQFSTPHGLQLVQADAVLLALGGGSWAKLGSDGSWVAPLARMGWSITPLKPSNCGFDCTWSDFLRSRFAGEPIKNVAASADLGNGSRLTRRGECLLTEQGIEGGLIYALSAALRDGMAEGRGVLYLDLFPDQSESALAREIAVPRGARSLSSHLQSRLGLKGVKAALMREFASPETLTNSHALARLLKNLPIPLTGCRPIDEAISTAGGVSLSDLDTRLMSRHFPGVFLAGEMLDWEAPTGGYLLTACFATGVAAAAGIEAFLCS